MNRTIVKKLAQLLTCIVLWGGGLFVANAAITIPLQYYPSEGIYTADLRIGKPPTSQTLAAIVDTGSAVLVVVADHETCSSCLHSFTKGHVNPNRLHLSQEKLITRIAYGSANDHVKEYEGPIDIASFTPSQWMKIYVIYQSNQPTSVLGLIPHNLKFDPIHSTPFIRKITQDFHTHTEATFILCGRHGNSYLQIGKMNLPTPNATTKLFITPFYEINVGGIFDEQYKPIGWSGHAVKPAILDTGTGGFIVLSNHLYQSLSRYLYAKAGSKNPKLDAKFWHQNYCVLRNQIDFKTFPLLRIGIAPLVGHQLQYLDLPPESYISSAGCPKDYVRMAFSSTPPKLSTAKHNDSVRKSMGKTPEMVIGTSLFNHYAFKIRYKPESMLYFYDNTSLCH
jgi:hypothetical protein